MIVVDREDGAKEVMRLQDVIDIPLQSKERAELINALLNRALEPLMRRGKKAGLKAAPLGFIINLLRLQSTDEQVILKQLGLLGGSNRKGGSNDSYGPMDEDTFNKIRAKVEVALNQYEEDHPREDRPPTPASTPAGSAGQVPAQPDNTLSTVDCAGYEGNERESGGDDIGDGDDGV
jgi:hypothetical protein